jgi:hypothetical protein
MTSVPERRHAAPRRRGIVDHEKEARPFEPRPRQSEETMSREEPARADGEQTRPERNRAVAKDSEAVGGTTPSNDEWISSEQAARMMGVSLTNIRTMRHRRQGPRFERFGTSVFYLKADVVAHLSRGEG